ncbi:putative dna repair protein dds20 mei5 protein [Zalerion maritima]|uniref:Dna repair protein dds20 mei5 protein n=1 Tax=Zalerion maritima TaxID=339359 RepID=A0AAD5RTU8_9PEZI|nr:putative dna repair protein dds20 mei5 protein [Zalerion maritima]
MLAEGCPLRLDHPVPAAMLTPAAKRRRFAAANETLKKPFKSPFANKNSTSASLSSSAKKGSGTLRDAAQTYASHESPLKRTASTGHPEDTSVQSSPERIHKATVPRRPHPAFSTSTTSRHRDQSPFLAAITSRQRAVDRDIKQLDDELEMAHQARRLLEEAAKKTPGKAPGSDLEALTLKWQAAARQAAEELFPTAKERYQSMGGSEGLRKMQQRQAAFFAEFDRPPKDNDNKSRGSSPTARSGALVDKGEDDEEEEEDLKHNPIEALQTDG